MAEDGGVTAVERGGSWQAESLADLWASARRIVMEVQGGGCICPDEPHQNALHDLANDVLRVLTATVDDLANDCLHSSATGIDTTPVGPGKVWRCDHCGLTWTDAGDGRRALATQRDGLAARIEALADEWQRELDTGAIRDEGARYCWSTATRELRRALATQRDGLAARHEMARHVHASECCWPFGGVTDVLIEALITAADPDRHSAPHSLTAEDRSTLAYLHDRWDNSAPDTQHSPRQDYEDVRWLLGLVGRLLGEVRS